MQKNAGKIRKHDFMQYIIILSYKGILTLVISVIFLFVLQ